MATSVLMFLCSYLFTHETDRSMPLSYCILNVINSFSYVPIIETKSLIFYACGLPTCHPS